MNSLKLPLKKIVQKVKLKQINTLSNRSGMMDSLTSTLPNNI